MIHELLKKAYTQKDWELVAEAYNQLTGKEIKIVPLKTKKKAGRPKKILVPTVEDIQVFENQQLYITEKENFEIKKDEKKAQSGKYGKNHNFLGTKNSWQDDARVEVDSFDKKVRNSKNNKPIERRQPIQHIRMECIDCQRNFNVLESDSDIRINEENGRKYYRCGECWVKRKYVRN